MSRRMFWPRNFFAQLAAALAMILLLPPAAGASSSSWPMLGHDVRRHGTTSTEIRPPFERKWYRLFPDEGIMSGVQPIVDGGKVFIPTLRGFLHAIDAESGIDAWVYSAPGPILHACATDGTNVFFGCADGKIYAIRATTGQVSWTVQTAAAVWNSPAIFEGMVAAGSRDRKMYAINASTGQIQWIALADGPILSSPAVDPARRRIYVGCEDMRVYAFNAKTGERLWVSHKLQGVTMRGYYPVTAPDGSVMVTVAPGVSLDRFNPILLEVTKQIFGDFASWRHNAAENEKWRRLNFEQLQRTETYRAQLDYLRRRLTQQPVLQTFFVLDPDTGKQKFVAPIVYGESMNGPGAPPIVTAEGKVIVKYQVLLRSRYEHYSPFLNVGYLDTTNGWITPIMDQSRTYGWHDSLLLVHDEQCQLMAAGSVLINTHQDNVNGMDLRTLQGYAQPFCRNIHEPKPGESLAIWARLLRGEKLPPGKEWLARGTAVYGGGSVLDEPVAVAGDSFYYLPTHEINSGAALIAYRMSKSSQAPKESETLAKPELTAAEWETVQKLPWDWDTLSMPRLDHVLKALPGKIPGTRESPLRETAEERVQKIADSDLDRFIWEPALEESRQAAVLSIGPNRSKNGLARLRGELNRAVRELLANEWRPLLFPAGKFPEETYRFFADPSETLYTIALAYPSVDGDQQQALRVFADRLLGNGLSGLFWQKAYPPDHGLVRSSYSPPRESLLRIGEIPSRTRLARLYPLWLWESQIKDGQRLEKLWPALASLVDSAGSLLSVEDRGNGELAGMIAYCRLAREVQDTMAVEKGVKAARAAMRERLRDEFGHTRGGVIDQVPVQRSIFVRWNRLTPDVGKLLQTYGRDTEQGLMETYVNYHRPTWWLAWNVELMMRNECPFIFPTVSQQIFAARAWILAEPAAQLARWIDIPWCKADEFYIQKLALILRAE